MSDCVRVCHFTYTPGLFLHWNSLPRATVGSLNGDFQAEAEWLPAMRTIAGDCPEEGVGLEDLMIPPKAMIPMGLWEILWYQILTKIG